MATYNHDDDDAIVDETESNTDGENAGSGGYDPQAMLKKTGEIQTMILDSIKQLPMEKLVNTPSQLESVSSFLNGVNNTAVQTIRNNIVKDATDVGMIADAVYDRMRKEKTSGIKRASDTGTKGRIPTNIDIPMDGIQEIEPGMLERGLVNQTFDEFAEKHDIVQAKVKD